MFARFKVAGSSQEQNVNVTLVRDFTPTEDGHTKLTFLGGDSMVVPFSAQAVRGAFKRALAPAETSES
jgi:hypothetical protein